MNNFALIASCLISFIIFYEAVVFFILLKLKKKLKYGDLFIYKSELGYEYKYHVRLSGGINCKWRKGWVTVKASFDENSHLINHEIIPLRFSDLISKNIHTRLSIRY